MHLNFSHADHVYEKIREAMRSRTPDKTDSDTLVPDSGTNPHKILMAELTLSTPAVSLPRPLVDAFLQYSAAKGFYTASFALRTTGAAQTRGLSDALRSLFWNRYYCTDPKSGAGYVFRDVTDSSPLIAIGTLNETDSPLYRVGLGSCGAPAIPIGSSSQFINDVTFFENVCNYLSGALLGSRRSSRVGRLNLELHCL